MIGTTKMSSHYFLALKKETGFSTLCSWILPHTREYGKKMVCNFPLFALLVHCSLFFNFTGRKFTFSTENKYHLLLSQSAALVKPSGYLVAFLNTHSMTSLQWEKQLIQGFNSLVERKHQMENERRQIQYRSLLRKKFKECTLCKIPCAVLIY